MAERKFTGYKIKKGYRLNNLKNMGLRRLNQQILILGGKDHLILHGIFLEHGTQSC